MPRQNPLAEAKILWDKIFEKDRLKWKRPDAKIIQLADQLSLRNLKSLYDLGCGNGRHATYFASRGFDVYASDISTTALKRAGLRLAEEGLSASLVETDMAGQPFKDNSFDAIVSYGVLFHNTLPKIQQSITDINRILRPGGLFFATLQSTEDWKYGRGQKIENDSFILDNPDHAEKGQVHHFFTKTSVADLLKGFRIAELEHRKHKDVFYHPEENLQYAIWLVLAEKLQLDAIGPQAKAGLIENLLNPVFAREFFEQNLHRLGWSNYKILDIKAGPIDLSKRGGKSVLEFNLRLHNKTNSQTIPKTIIAKWRPDARNQETFRLMQQLWDKDFRGQDHLKICEPIAYLPESNLMLTSKATGLELDKIFAADDPQLESYIVRAVRWLAKLHETRIARGRDYTISQEEEKLTLWQQHLATLYPDAARTLDSLTDSLLEIERSVKTSSYVLIHGDYHPKNIFVDRDDLTTIDFEQSVIYDPARDLGYFTAQLNMKTRKYGLSRDPRFLRKRFLEEYSLHRPIDALERVEAYEAITYLQHLHYVYYTLKKTLDPTDFQYWMGRAEECLRTMR